jgi:hypothetical protein
MVAVFIVCRLLLVTITGMSMLLWRVSAKGYGFSTCDDVVDNMGVRSISISPDYVACGDTALITVGVKPTVTVYDGALAKLTVTKLGFVVDTVSVDVCSSLIGSVCPILPSQTAKVQMQVSLDSSGCISTDVTVTAETYNNNGDYESCVQLVISLKMSGKERLQRKRMTIVIVIVVVIATIILSAVVAYCYDFWSCARGARIDPIVSKTYES